MKKTAIRLPRTKRIRARRPAPTPLPQPGTGLKQEALVIFTSPTGRPPWHPVKPEEVPDWVKHPETMANLIAGEECMKCDEGDRGSNWYRAVRASEINEALKADH